MFVGGVRQQRFTDVEGDKLSSIMQQSLAVLDNLSKRYGARARLEDFLARDDVTGSRRLDGGEIP